MHNFYATAIKILNNHSNCKLYFHIDKTNAIEAILTIYNRYFIFYKDIREITKVIYKRDSHFDNNKINSKLVPKYIRKKVI